MTIDCQATRIAVVYVVCVRHAVDLLEVREMLTELFDNLLKRDIKKITSRSLHKAGISKNKANIAATDESQTAKAATSVYKISRIVSTHFDENEEEMAEVEWFHTFESLDDLPKRPS
ncbi:hypothetical protein L916_06032, partial [Phytophthora nicotianae]